MLRFVVWRYDCNGQQQHQLLNRHLSRWQQLDIAVSATSLVYPHPVLYVYLYLSCWSNKRIGGPFYNFQWDALLLETLLVAALLATARSAMEVSMVLWLMKLLLFRLMFGSGLVKGKRTSSAFTSRVLSPCMHSLQFLAEMQAGIWTLQR